MTECSFVWLYIPLSLCSMYILQLDVYRYRNVNDSFKWLHVLYIGIYPWREYYKVCISNK